MNAQDDRARFVLNGEPHALPADGRVLVLGCEELMYTPMLLAAELTGYHGHVRFSSTTRSPVLPVDEPGYAIRSRIQYAAHDGTGGGPRFAYNVAGAGFDAVVLDRFAPPRPGLPGLPARSAPPDWRRYAGFRPQREWRAGR